MIIEKCTAYFFLFVKIKRSGSIYHLDHSNIDMDFTLAQKSFSVTINAISMLVIHRPIFFKDFAKYLACHTIDLPPIPNDSNDHHHSIITKQKQSKLSNNSSYSILSDYFISHCINIIRIITPYLFSSHNLTITVYIFVVVWIYLKFVLD